METAAGGNDAYACPSFSSYSCDQLAEIAVQVAAESNSSNDGGGGDFEFALVRQENDYSAENLFTDGRIGSVFPVFNRDLLLNHGGESGESSRGKELESSSVLIPFSKLLIQERECEAEAEAEADADADNPPSCSSSEADELEQIPAGTYCVWRPKLAESPRLPSQCKKSKSTGSSSRRWRLRDLMRRSNSDGKDSFVFLTPKHNHHHELNKSEKPNQSPKGSKGNTPLRSSGAGSPSAHEAFYVRSRAMSAAEKKKSYLPYRQDLVGFFANVNGLRRSFPRF